MRKTKIVCTIGTASAREDIMEKMLDNGMNVARINLSHDDHSFHCTAIETLKHLRETRRVPLAILLETRGPELRLGKFATGTVLLEMGEDFTLTTKPVTGNRSICSVSLPGLPAQLKAGDKLVFDYGRIEMRVVETTQDEVHCRIVRGGKLTGNKSIKIPGVHLDVPYISEQDREDLRFAARQDVDFVAASFVRCKEDVMAVRSLLNENGGENIRIIAKIENLESADHIDEILACSDGIMVARGNMGVEIEFEKLPGIQKRFIRKCYQAGKMVITANQMLDSMITHAYPTRAEITDVANAVFDGTSAVMLSGETSTGDYPAEAVSVMARVTARAEKDAFALDAFSKPAFAADASSALCDAACRAAQDIKAKAILAVTQSGLTARNLSKFRPSEPIIAATPVVKTFHQLAMSWGVYPVLAEADGPVAEMKQCVTDAAKAMNAVAAGDQVVIAASDTLSKEGIILQVETVL